MKGIYGTTFSPLIELSRAWQDRRRGRACPFPLSAHARSTVETVRSPDRADTRRGEVGCVCPETGTQRCLAFQGFEAERGTLKYRCPGRPMGMAVPAGKAVPAPSSRPPVRSCGLAHLPDPLRQPLGSDRLERSAMALLPALAAAVPAHRVAAVQPSHWLSGSQRDRMRAGRPRSARFPVADTGGRRFSFGFKQVRPPPCQAIGAAAGRGEGRRNPRSTVCYPPEL